MILGVDLEEKSWSSDRNYCIKVHATQIKNGKNIYPEELESLVAQLPYVAENMVFGMPKGDDLVVSVKVVYNETYVKQKYGNISENELKEIAEALGCSLILEFEDIKSKERI